MARCIVASAEEALDQEFSVLDKGFVRLIDYMGADERIVEAARVSYQKGSRIKRSDNDLIDYLLRNAHTSPFEQVVLTFHCKAPIFVARQWLRHRTARLNEISGRYSIMKDEFYIPSIEDISEQSRDNKQGRGERVSKDIAHKIREVFLKHHEILYTDYEEALHMGVAREIARINLPLSLYTQWYWQIDLNNLFHFLKLRLHIHAQKEIRSYAAVILDLTGLVVPQAVQSFKKHILNGVSLSESETNLLRESLNFDSLETDERTLRILKEKLNLTSLYKT